MHMRCAAAATKRLSTTHRGCPDLCAGPYARTLALDCNFHHSTSLRSATCAGTVHGRREQQRRKHILGLAAVSGSELGVWVRTKDGNIQVGPVTGAHAQAGTLRPACPQPQRDVAYKTSRAQHHKADDVQRYRAELLACLHVTMFVSARGCALGACPAQSRSSPWLCVMPYILQFLPSAGRRLIETACSQLCAPGSNHVAAWWDVYMTRPPHPKQAKQIQKLQQPLRQLTRSREARPMWCAGRTSEAMHREAIDHRLHRASMGGGVPSDVPQGARACSLSASCSGTDATMCLASTAMLWHQYWDINATVAAYAQRRGATDLHQLRCMAAAARRQVYHLPATPAGSCAHAPSRIPGTQQVANLMQCLVAGPAMLHMLHGHGVGVGGWAAAHRHACALRKFKGGCTTSRGICKTAGQSLCIPQPRNYVENTGFSCSWMFPVRGICLPK